MLPTLIPFPPAATTYIESDLVARRLSGASASTTCRSKPVSADSRYNAGRCLIRTQHRRHKLDSTLQTQAVYTGGEQHNAAYRLPTDILEPDQ